MSRPDPITELMGFFEFEHLPEELQEVSGPCHDLACSMYDQLEGSAEKTAGMRKLLEAKDCFVRAKLVTIKKRLA